MISFEEKFKDYTATELLEIISNPNSYQPDAVLVANNILESRQLGKKDLIKATNAVAQNKQEQEAREKKRIAIENNIRLSGTSLLQNLNPLQQTVPNETKIINIFSALFGLLFLYELYETINLIYFLKMSDLGLDLSVLIEVLSTLYIGATVCLFFMRKKEGWYLFATLLTFFAVSFLNALPLAIQNHQNFNGQLSSLPSIGSCIALFLLFSGNLLVICKPNIRKIYSINKTAMFLNIVMIAVLTFVIYHIVFSY